MSIRKTVEMIAVGHLGNDLNHVKGNPQFSFQVQNVGPKLKFPVQSSFNEHKLF